jgi:hypothetical protein
LFANIPVADVGGKITLFQSKDLYKVHSCMGHHQHTDLGVALAGVRRVRWVISPLRSGVEGFVRAAIAFTLGAFRLYHCSSFVAQGLYLTRRRTTDSPTMWPRRCTTPFSASCTAVRAVLAFSIVVLMRCSSPGLTAGGLVPRCVGPRTGSVREPAAPLALARRRSVRGSAKGALRVIAAAVAFVVLVFGHPTPLRIVGLGIVTLVVLGIIEFFGREPCPTRGADPTLQSPIPRRHNRRLSSRTSLIIRSGSAAAKPDDRAKVSLCVLDEVALYLQVYADAVVDTPLVLDDQTLTPGQLGTPPHGDAADPATDERCALAPTGNAGRGTPGADHQPPVRQGKAEQFGLLDECRGDRADRAAAR